jgi:hypothetical protein
MSDDNFVSRWSRLKRESEQRRKVPPEAEASDARPSDGRDERAAEAPGQARPTPERPFDPATLPPIDSIVAGKDIRAFLQKGVPAELTKAALRRAWASDPAIRDFIGLAENQWDFTDPTAIPGFGTLEATDNVGQLVAQAMGKLPDAPDAVALSQEERKDTSSEPDVSPALPPPGTPDHEPSSIEAEGPVEIAAAQHPEPLQKGNVAPSRKGHGRALPR